jgi:hypothetical protein
MLAREACKISDGGQLNSGTAAEPFFDYGGYNERRKREFLGGPGACSPWKFWNLRPPGAPEMQLNLLVAVRKFFNRRLLI